MPISVPNALAAFAVVVATTALCSGGSSGSSAGGSPSTSASASASAAPSGVAPAAYMHQVCGSLASRLKQINVLVKTYERNVKRDAPSGGLPALKRDTIVYFHQAVRQFQGMKSGVAAAGVPAVDNGERVRQDLLDAFDILVNAAKRAEADVHHLSTTDQKAFSRRLIRDGRVVGKGGAQVGKQLDKDSTVGGPALDRAAKNDPACKKLNAA